MKTLILGGARSGKSRLAEQTAARSGHEVVYIATARAGDSEMQARIVHHREQRPSHWRCVESPNRLAAVLQQEANDRRCLLVDCLTLWLSQALLQDESVWMQERDAFLHVVPNLPGELILVSNETGLGIVPLGEINRRFCDESGRLHQALASHCDRVWLTVAGLPLALKGELS